VDAFYSPEKDRKSIAAFSVFVAKAAENGDETALGILKNQAYLLSCTVKSLLDGMPSFPHIALYGGVFQHCEIFTSYFRDFLEGRYSSCEKLLREPVFGAVIAAREISV
jgi:N-acetylglucosamine kinase-like BadF-type ATPase